GWPPVAEQSVDEARERRHLWEWASPARTSGAAEVGGQTAAPPARACSAAVGRAWRRWRSRVSPDLGRQGVAGAGLQRGDGEGVAPPPPEAGAARWFGRWSNSRGGRRQRDERGGGK
ncbi:unnamed protein product, partial [Urochloa humidicola]